MRIAAGIEYDGRHYCGWQRLSHADSVQETLERALSRVADHALKCVCAGRTDSGVHAQCQIVHFDASTARPLHAWVLGGNSHLPDSIVVRWAQPVSDDFHARFCAVARSYRYVILNQPVPTAILSGKVTWVRHPLNIESMQRAAERLIGEHDFSSFRAAGCEAKTPVRTVTDLNVTRDGDFIYLDIRANAFLHHMVRNIAGTLIAIGQGKRSPGWSTELLQIRDRTQGDITAPAEGLYFVSAHYPDNFGLPQPPLPIRFG
jgi:tRNA pseudouridine38-40 synthase